jgi:hypothetical protein
MALNGPIEIFQSAGSTEAATIRIGLDLRLRRVLERKNRPIATRRDSDGFHDSPQAFSRGRAIRAYPFEIQRTKKWAVVESRPATASAPASIRGDGLLLDVVH